MFDRGLIGFRDNLEIMIHLIRSTMPTVCSPSSIRPKAGILPQRDSDRPHPKFLPGIVIIMPLRPRRPHLRKRRHLHLRLAHSHHPAHPLLGRRVREAKGLSIPDRLLLAAEHLFKSALARRARLTYALGQTET
ncbi:MAG: hypothetical protein R3D89_06370 [Sphingomonadaceae bacterium]